MSLPQLVNIPVTLKIGGMEIQAQQATIKDFALLQEYAKKLEDDKDPQSSLKQMLYAIQICVQKAYPDESVTTDYLMNLLPVTAMSEIGKAMEQLGFMTPTKVKKE